MGIVAAPDVPPFPPHFKTAPSSSNEGASAERRDPAPRGLPLAHPASETRRPRVQGLWTLSLRAVRRRHKATELMSCRSHPFLQLSNLVCFVCLSGGLVGFVSVFVFLYVSPPRHSLLNPTKLGAGPFRAALQTKTPPADAASKPRTKSVRKAGRGLVLFTGGAGRKHEGSVSCLPPSRDCDPGTAAVAAGESLSACATQGPVTQLPPAEHLLDARSWAEGFW